ncbi:MAG: MMPL family transporter [Candidatus Sericytochromatia bacterium]|nr:MMPL family transporter [Candidatus Tanganyikabacteria bacterium]
MADRSLPAGEPPGPVHRPAAIARLLVLLLWLALAAAGLYAGTKLEARLDRQAAPPPGSESARVAAVLAERFPALAGQSHLAVVSGRSGAYAHRLARALEGRVLRFAPDLAGIWVAGERDVGAMRATIARTTPPPGVTVALTGPEEAVLDLYAFLGEQLALIEKISLGAALVVLLLVLRSLRLALHGLSVGIACLLAAPAGIYLLSHFKPISSLNLVVAAVVALAMGLDYSLLFLARWREEGDLARVMRTAGRTIATTALILVGAGLSILWVPLPALHSVGLTLAFEAVLAALAALTLLPALPLGQAGTPPPPPAWVRLPALVARHPLTSLLGALLAIALLAMPLAGIKTWSPSYAILPPGLEAARAVRALEAAGVAGAVSPIVVVSGQAAKLATDIGADPRVGRVWSSGADLLIVESRQSPDHPAIAGLVRDLRRMAAPGGAVGGGAAAQLDVEVAIWRALPLVVGTNLLSILLILGWHLRSVVLPLKAIATNLLPVAAGLGVVVALAARDGSPVQTLTVLIMGTLLLALSQDYEIFILSRVREAFEADADHAAAVAAGMRGAGPVVIGAALVMLSVFVPFCFAAAPGLRELGVGLATAIAVDATLVRLVLVPAALTLMADWNWWHPFKA